MRNLKFAFRTLFKTPFVTVVAILSLALGIGANAAIYSLFNQILRQPLPVQAPERLVNLANPGPQSGSNSCNQAGGCDEIFSYAMFRDLEKARTAFSGVAAHRLLGANVAMPGQTPLNGELMLVSGSYFPVLGLHPTIGRLIGPEDDATIGANYVAVLNFAYWESQLGSNPSVLGQKMTVNGQQFTIVGVGPRGFNGTTMGARPFLYMPISMRHTIDDGFRGFDERRNYWVYAFARLKPGASIEQATSAVNTAYKPILNDVEAPLQKGMSAATLTRFRAKEITLSDGRKGQSSMIKQSTTPILLLFSITAIVLLIACANIANLLLARAANRAMEMAVRLSLGALRRQLITQLLTESVLLAVLGGLLGIAVANITLHGITAMLPSQMTSSMDFALSGAALWFTALVSLATGILFGLVPALQSTRPDLVTELRNNSGKLSGGRGAARFRTSLVTAQIALSMALLISAGLFIKSLRNVSRVDLGITIDNMVTFGISPGLSGYDTTRAKALYARVEEALQSTPGITGVTSAMVPLLTGSNWGNSVSVEGFRKDPDTDDNARFDAVGANYFRVLGVPLLAGRDFTVSDGPGGPPVAIVNEAFAKKFKLGRNTVGKHMSTSGSDSLNIEIVGLVKDAKYSQVKDEIPPVYVLPYRQYGRVTGNYFYVRSALPTDQIMRAIRNAMRNIDPNLPIEDLKTMPQQVRENVFLDRMISTMSVAFAVLATLLAAIGLYGVLAYSVVQRTREIGVRMALGADGGRVRGMVLRQVGLMTLVGGIIGVAGAIGLGKAAQSLLFELKGTDPIVFTIAALALLAVAFAAGYVPALRASRIDPMQALRYE
ncbi:MAG TPA: ABC transporter permease [Gemmatimonadaceae bacterium]|jgi:predicted permease|nr:ABC transporter permease [Gemmatimonadaceae bacterium]